MMLPPSPFRRLSDISIDSLSVEVLRTGFSCLDEAMFLKKGLPELVTVAAGSSHGKSALMLQIGAHIARTAPVYMFSLEMDDRALKTRLLSQVSGIRSKDIKLGLAKRSELEKAEKELQKLNLSIEALGRTDIGTIVDHIQRYAAPNQPGLIILDYLQYLTGPTASARTYEIAYALKQLKSVAKVAGCPILMGAQLNRNYVSRGKAQEAESGFADYTPSLIDLRDSSSIEHDSDAILFISRPEQIDGSRKGEAHLSLAKNREGELGKWTIRWEGRTCSFRE